LDSWLKERDLLNRLLQQHLLHAQQRMKANADANRTERVFQEGEMVYLKIQPYIQSTVASRSNQKLSFKFFGPYKILKKIGTVAYQLDLPDHVQIHPVVHVSQLKRCAPSTTEVTEDIMAISTDPDLVVSPQRILERSLVAKGTTSAFRIKVQWSGLPTSLATWEDEEDLRRRFTTAAAWGPAAF